MTNLCASLLTLTNKDSCGINQLLRRVKENSLFRIQPHGIHDKLLNIEQRHTKIIVTYLKNYQANGLNFKFYGGTCNRKTDKLSRLGNLDSKA